MKRLFRLALLVAVVVALANQVGGCVPGATPADVPRAAGPAGPVVLAPSLAQPSEPPRAPASPPRATPASTPRATPAPTPRVEVVRPGGATTPTRLAVDPALSADLAEFLGHQKGTYGVALAELTSGTAALVNADQRFVTASLYKLFLMYEVLRLVERGELSLADTVTTLEEYPFPEPPGGIPPATTVTIDAAIRAMIGSSSNAGALALLNRVGAAALREAPGRLGLEATELTARASGSAPGHYFVDGTTTPTDLLTFFVQLDAGRLVGPRPDAYMQEVLLGQRLNDRLPVLLPPYARVAHKTGDLEHAVHDAGIVYAPGRRFVAVVLSRDVPYDDSPAVIAEIGRAAYAFFVSRG